MHHPHPSLFRAYDVRGIVGETLQARDFLAIGQALASHVAERCQTRTPLIVVMRDGRLSSPNLAEAMIEGCIHAGAHVLDGGMGPTPLCYFAAHHLAADAGVMITGSHNPPQHNGAKFVCEGLSLYGEELASLRTRLERGNLLHSRGFREEIDLVDEYIVELERALGDSPVLDQLPIAFDAGNGAAGDLLSRLIAGRAITHTGLHLAVDGNFPNHHPDPADPENLRDLQQAIARDPALAFGVAFDGDGDRLGAVDDLGRAVAPDHLLMLLADDVLSRKPSATIIADVKTSDQFFARVTAGGGQALMWNTGHALIKSKMREVGAAFAGEASGHLFFADEYFGYDDGLYAAMRLMRLVAASGRKLSALVDALPPLYATPEIRIACPDETKFTVVARVASALQAQGAQINTRDGVRVSTTDGWWLLRASNTQAVLVARAEGKSPEALVRVRDAMAQALRAQDITIS